MDPQSPLAPGQQTARSWTVYIGTSSIFPCSRASVEGVFQGGRIKETLGDVSRPLLVHLEQDATSNTILSNALAAERADPSPFPQRRVECAGQLLWGEEMELAPPPHHAPDSTSPRPTARYFVSLDMHQGGWRKETS